MGFASGFRAGYDTVRDIQERRRKEELRQGLQRAGALEPTQQTMADPEMVRNLEAAGINPQTGQPYYTVRDGYVQPNFAVETTAAMPAGPDQITAGVGSDQIPVVQPGARGIESRLAPAEAVRIPETTQYQLGGLTRETPFTQSEIQRARTEEMARVYEQQGMPEEAVRMRQLAQQQELTGLQLGQARRTAERQSTLDTAIADAMKLPEKDQMPAILKAYRAIDPAQALSIESTMGNIELNNITRQAKQYEIGLQQALTKGVDATMQWIDKQEPGFTLMRQGNQIIQTNTDGSTQVFARGTEDQLLQQFASRATPSTLLDYARLKVTENYYNNLAAEKAKMDPAVKTQLDYLEAESLAIHKAAAEDPTNPNLQLAAQKAKLNLFSAYKDAGIKGIDPYRSSGVPSPTEAAGGILSANPLPKETTPRRLAAWQAEIDRDVARAEQLYGSAYAAEVRTSLEKRAPRGLTQAAPEGTPPTGVQTTPVAAQPTTSRGLVRDVSEAFLSPARPSIGGRTPGRGNVPIPPVPPQRIPTRGGRMIDNPEYEDWMRLYGSTLGPQ